MCVVNGSMTHRLQHYSAFKQCVIEPFSTYICDMTHSACNITPPSNRAEKTTRNLRFFRDSNSPTPPLPVGANGQWGGGGAGKCIQHHLPDSRNSRQIVIEPQTISRDVSLPGNSTFRTPPPRAARQRGEGGVESASTNLV